MADLELTKATLGFGLMRLPSEKTGQIDIEATKTLVDEYIKNGFNYFDTALGYPGSEEAFRKCVAERYSRDSYSLATKLSGFAVRQESELYDAINISLRRTGAEYIDYYLLHSLSRESDAAIYSKNSLWDFGKRLRDEGKIRHFGFSFHDRADYLEELLDHHPEAEFVQLQINYLDWEDANVQSRKCYEAARKYNKPIIVMEPNKGGVLASSLPESVREIFRKVNPYASGASWAMRFVASLPGVAVILSGMNTLEQMHDNMTFMKNVEVLTDTEAAAIVKAREILLSMDLIQCTSCGYCLKGCPVNIQIPHIMNPLNRYTMFSNLEDAKFLYSMAAQHGAKASECIACGACEAVCPQHISIRENLGKAVSIFE